MNCLKFLLIVAVSWVHTSVALEMSGEWLCLELGEPNPKFVSVRILNISKDQKQFVDRGSVTASADDGNQLLSQIITISGALDVSSKKITFKPAHATLQIDRFDARLGPLDAYSKKMIDSALEPEQADIVEIDPDNFKIHNPKNVTADICSRRYSSGIPIPGF
jgi:hypothetical protein